MDNIDVTSYSTCTVALPVSKGQVVILQVAINYDNGCTSSYAEEEIVEFINAII